MKYVDMEWHKAAELLPLMAPHELEQLAEDIKTHGLRAPIVLLGGAILDGRNRHRACQLAGVEPKFVYANLGEIGDPFVYVASLNLHRRHLNESQRALVGARLKEHFAEQARERQGTRTDLLANLPGGSRNARDDAAALVNVSPRSVESAARVLERGAPELVEAVDRGEVAVSAAAEIARLPRETQAQAVQQGTVSKLAKEQRAARKVKPVEDESTYDPGEDDGDVELFDASQLAVEAPAPAAPSPAFTIDAQRMQEFRAVSAYVAKGLAYLDAMQSCPQLADIVDSSTRKMLENLHIKIAAFHFSRLPEDATTQRPVFRVIEGGNK